jgi:hypothetical protein
MNETPFSMNLPISLFALAPRGHRSLALAAPDKDTHVAAGLGQSCGTGI